MIKVDTVADATEFVDMAVKAMKNNGMKAFTDEQQMLLTGLLCGLIPARPRCEVCGGSGYHGKSYTEAPDLRCTACNGSGSSGRDADDDAASLPT